MRGWCFLIIVLDKGQIVEQGRHKTLLKLQNHYARLHQMQFRGQKSGGD